MIEEYVIIQDLMVLFQKIQVDFEGRNPVDADFHGIKQLLQQLFLKAHINLSELADLIIGQNYVGSVVKVHRLSCTEPQVSNCSSHQ